MRLQHESSRAPSLELATVLCHRSLRDRKELCHRGAGTSRGLVVLILVLTTSLHVFFLCAQFPHR